MECVSVGTFIIGIWFGVQEGYLNFGFFSEPERKKEILEEEKVSTLEGPKIQQVNHEKVET